VNKKVNRILKIVFSGLFAGIIAGGGALTAVGTEMPPDASIGDTGGWTWLVIGITFLVAAAKDWKTYLAQPPAS
jgi:hypothetical protein